MVYYNSLNTNGVTIDGMPDTNTPGAITWEMVTGQQGTLITIGSVLTDITPFAYASYYSDDSTPAVTQCTGDPYEYGTSGMFIVQTIPSTDAVAGGTNHLRVARVDYYDAPGQTVAAAALRQSQATTPLQVSAATFQGDSDCDGMADAWELAYLGNLNSDGTADTDGDSVCDRAEYIAGTNPMNSASAPTLSIALSGGQSAISFTVLAPEGPGYAGLTRYYTLETSADLSSGNWGGIPGYTDLIGNNQVVTYPPPLDPTPRFYRTRIELR
jgi:hypothetical protein